MISYLCYTKFNDALIKNVLGGGQCQFKLMATMLTFDVQWNSRLDPP